MEEATTFHKHGETAEATGGKRGAWAKATPSKGEGHSNLIHGGRDRIMVKKTSDSPGGPFRGGKAKAGGRMEKKVNNKDWWGPIREGKVRLCLRVAN